MKTRNAIHALLALASAVCSPWVLADNVVSEDFTGAATNNPWFFFNGACLTAGTSTSTASPGVVPACTTIAQSYYGAPLVGGSQGYLGSSAAPSTASGQVPDPVGSGALRFTNGYPYGYSENGAIVSQNTFPTGAGVQVTFKTVTYRGNSAGGGGDGADGMSFFLMDGAVAPNLGAYGGSLGYTCSNVNPPFNGAVGAYIGLGIDEYGNFLNPGDNTASGPGYQWGRIGLRGVGNVAWSWLTQSYPLLYPGTTSAADQQSIVANTCRSGVLTDASNNAILVSGNQVPVADYAAIPNAYTVLPAGITIANEAAVTRNDATPITYRLQITQDGLLSFSYSYNGGAYQSVLQNQSITASNGSMPGSFRFGFAGSTGGGTNVHEILCFKASPAQTSGASTSVNEKQASKVETGSQAYFAYYNPTNWTGSVTGNPLIDIGGVVTVGTTANWDASCNLTGIAAAGTCATTGAAGPVAAQSPASRVMLTWSGSSGVPFEWSNITGAQQNALDAGDATPFTANRLLFLRGDRTNEINNSGAGLFRARDGVLGDVMDSSPTWVGPPSLPYTGIWKDQLYPTAAVPENSGQSYLAFSSAYQSRLNVVYTGANDGFMHGFRSGSFDSNNNFINGASTPNDGQEVLAYMPAAVVNTIHNATVRNLDYANTQYGHNFYVDATPGTGELYYNGAWHTWLVSGLGAGGSAIFALDITNPTTTNFSETNASSLVVGEWNSSNIACVGNGGCGQSLGNTFGTPLIRRLHNGQWGVIFGNGYGSSTGAAGIFVMTVNPSSGATQFYYLDTGATGSNGIAYTDAADLDGDNITDYVYAGDLQGNLWRFDLTSSNPTAWAAGAAPMFTTPGGQPITSKVVVASVPVVGSALSRVIVSFGTGKRTQLTNSTPTSYASGTQSLYGVWDWNLGAWNALASTQYFSLTAGATGLGSPYTMLVSKLQQQAFTLDAAGNRIENPVATICWMGGTVCGGGNNSFGWYANLPGSSEQILYAPVFFNGAVIFDSIVPANTSTLTCTNGSDTGYTYILNVGTGGAYPNVFPDLTTPYVAGTQTNAAGSAFVVTTAENTTYIVYQSINPPCIGPACTNNNTKHVNITGNVEAKRLTWVELR